MIRRHDYSTGTLSLSGLDEFFAAFLTSFSLIGLAEMGDKSQLVCMTLAARYRALPVLFGAILAFVLLNLLAVLVGAALSEWIPQEYISLAVGLLFILFGIHAMRATDDDAAESVDEQRGSHGIFISTLLLIMLAELGDKTQLAVAGLASTANVYAVWLGATLALTATSALGVWAGNRWLKKISIQLLHRVSGSLFILIGLLTLISLA